MNRILCLYLLLLVPLSGLAESDVEIMVLGIAQDAGYPQTNCFADHCMRAWQDKSLRRTTSSIAVIHRGAREKYLFDATPDIRDQLYRLNREAPDGDYRFNGVFLTHAHMGHYTGLMHVGHESASMKQLPVYVMPRFREYLENNGPWDQLVSYENITLMELADGRPVSMASDLQVTPMLVPHRDEYSETVGYRIDGPSKSAIFIPDIDKWERWEVDLRKLVADVDYALIDAAFFADGELPGRDMSKIPHPFVSESMALLDELPADIRARVIFIHMNHTNPLLIEGSEARKEVERRGYRVAREGMKLKL